MRLRANVSLDTPQLIDPRLLSAGAAIGRLGKALALGMIDIPNRIGQAAIDSYEGKFNPLDPGSQAAVGQDMFRGALDAGLGMGKYSANALAINRSEVFRKLVSDAPDKFKKLSKTSQDALLTAIKTMPKVALDAVDNVTWGGMRNSEAFGSYDNAMGMVRLNENFDAVAEKALKKYGYDGNILETVFHEFTHGVQNKPDAADTGAIAESLIQKLASKVVDYGDRPSEVHARSMGELFGALYKRGKLTDEIDSDKFLAVFNKYQKRATDELPKALTAYSVNPDDFRGDALNAAEFLDELRRTGSFTSEHAGLSSLLRKMNEY